jgi:hypothetical protein
MSGETQAQESGWTIDTLKALVDERERHQRELSAERDRRYAEVAEEREKALKIKEEADKAALTLQRIDQTYKDEQGNKLREQINSERNTYVTGDQLAAAVREMTGKIQPLTDFVSGQNSVKASNQDGRSTIVILISIAVAVISLVALILSQS